MLCPRIVRCFVQLKSLEFGSACFTDDLLNVNVLFFLLMGLFCSIEDLVLLPIVRIVINKYWGVNLCAATLMFVAGEVEKQSSRRRRTLLGTACRKDVVTMALAAPRWLAKN